MAEMNSAISLDPLSPVLVSLAATPLLAAHQYDQALERLHKVQELDPQFPFCSILLAAGLRTEGRFPKCHQREGRQVALGFGDNPEALPPRGSKLFVVHLQTRGSVATGGLTGLSQGRRGKLPPRQFYFATLYARVGDREQAFHWLEKPTWSTPRN